MDKDVGVKDEGLFHRVSFAVSYIFLIFLIDITERGKW
jgi:hypothetical protein